MNDWPMNYIGKKFDDCWHLVRQVYGTELAVVLPDHARGLIKRDLADIVRRIHAGTTGGDWKKIKDPIDLCIVALSRSTLIHHVGVWTECDGGKVVHAEVDYPAVAHSLMQLQRNGYQRVEFYVLA
jgi:hypothetical protein